jgi:hypothetical protein
VRHNADSGRRESRILFRAHARAVQITGTVCGHSMPTPATKARQFRACSGKNARVGKSQLRRSLSARAPRFLDGGSGDGFDDFGVINVKRRLDLRHLLRSCATSLPSCS